MSIPLADFGVAWFEDIVGQLIAWCTGMLTSGYDALTAELFATPTPEGSTIDAVFTRPPAGDDPWHAIYESTVAGEMMLFGLLVLFICVQGRHFIRVFDLGSAREHRQTRRSALTGAFVIVSWYWIAVLTLSVVEALTIGLLPDVEAVASGLVSIVPQTLETPLVTLLFAGAGSIAIVVLRAMFVLRELLLYVFLHVMPIGIGIAYGNVPIVSEIARRFCVQFVALAVLPIPTALLLRGYSLLFSGSETISIGSPFVAYVAVISLPIVAAYVTWKTFAYAAPLTSRALGRASRGTILVGTVGAAANAAGPRAAAMATKWGPRGAASAMLSERNDSRDPGDSTATDSGDDRASYRRTENDRR